MKALIKIITFVCLCLYFQLSCHAANRGYLLEIKGTMGPATQDYVQRGIKSAEDDKAELIILTLDTPGGLDASVKGINKAILTSSVPIITYVSPSGARAATPGRFILSASSIAAMTPGTHLGAASNVSSLSASEALKQNVIHLIADDTHELLQQLHGKSVKTNKIIKVLNTQQIEIKTLTPDWRSEFLSIITNPTIAYILILIGFYGIFFELANPGFILPGAIGSICLVIALYAFHLLPINYTGLSLLLIGIAGMVAEIFVFSFGILGASGLAAFVIGSIMLFDRTNPEFVIAWYVIALMGLLTAGFILMIFMLAFRSLNKPILTGREALIGANGTVLQIEKNVIMVRVFGETWMAKSSHTLKVGDTVSVEGVKDLILKVKPPVEKKS